MLTILLTYLSTFHLMQDEVFLKQLGQNIKKIRQEKGISQVELGGRCDFEKSAMNRIEAGRTNVTVLNLKKIAEGLDVDVNYLLVFH